VVSTTRNVEIVDVSGVELRLSSINTGLRVTYAMCAAGGAYAFATLDRPHRTLIAVLLVAGALVSVLISLLPVERIVRSRWNEGFFLGWSALQIALIAALAAADGGARSPLALGFFVPILFAAVSYPLWSVVTIGALAVLTFLGLDVVMGPHDPGYLVFFSAALAAGAILCASQAQNQDRQRAGLERISRTDPLTGSLNRRGFEERLDAELSNSTRHGRPLALVLLDLDNFKEINDLKGHPAGDELLRWAVSTMKDVLRTADDVGRLGGDEFAILLPDTLRADAETIGGRIRDELSERISTSMGITSFPIDGTDSDELLKHGDAELYAAKHGRSSWIAPVPRDLSWAAALAAAVDSRMAVQHDHSTAVADNADVIATQLNWSESELSLLRVAAMLHDVGKVAVPDGILRKPGPLTAEEFAEIAKHPIVGSEIVGRIESLEPIVPWIRHAHEHFDGTGYPDGIRGEAIPLASRILLVADAYDAMTSDRPYRRALSTEEAWAELKRGAGTIFDPQCVELFERGLESPAARPDDALRA
jgi:diguanylate cyclase (GGDEF)-like protein